MGLTETGSTTLRQTRGYGIVPLGLRPENRFLAAGCASVAFVTVLVIDISPSIAAGDNGLAAQATDTIAGVMRRLIAAARVGLDHHPAAMLALAAGALLPIVAIASSLTRAAGRLFANRRSKRAAVTASPVAGGFDVAWIERDGTAPTRIGELTRIGSADDCELAITPPASGGEQVLHAVIQRTPEREFIVFDVARAADLAMTVNGEPAAARRLTDGDEIAVGAERFVFRVGSGSEAADAAQLA